MQHAGAVRNVSVSGSLVVNRGCGLFTAGWLVVLAQLTTLPAPSKRLPMSHAMWWSSSGLWIIAALALPSPPADAHARMHG
eukprot:364500-Chlamydomonas_euryale.AAC.39